MSQTSESADICQSYSQAGQDKYLLERYFSEVKDGFYIEVGAHDGVTYSNTLLFEKKGWRGLLFEPIPEVYNRLVKNRKGEAINACAYDRNGTVDFILNKGYSEMLSGVRECYDERHYNRLAREQLKQGGDSDLILSRCVTLTDELSKRGVNHVDFISIDVEGGELKVLQGLDFKKIDVSVILIEDNYPDKFKPIHSLLEENGYILDGQIGIDKIYVKKRSS